MTRLVLPAIVAGCVVLGQARGEDPKLPANANAPNIVLASAAEADGKVTIKLRVYESMPAPENRTITVYETVTQIVDGKPTTKQVPVEKTVRMIVMKPTRWKEIKLSAEEPGIEVRDLAGELVSMKKLPKLLEKETAILLSTNGPVDPFHLQLAKEGTLVLMAPAEKVGANGFPGLMPIGPPAIGAGAIAPGAIPVPATPPPLPAPPPPLPKKN